jgi:hypothetical protein
VARWEILNTMFSLMSNTMFNVSLSGKHQSDERQTQKSPLAAGLGEGGLGYWAVITKSY